MFALSEHQNDYSLSVKQNLEQSLTNKCCLGIAQVNRLCNFNTSTAARTQSYRLNKRMLANGYVHCTPSTDLLSRCPLLVQTCILLVQACIWKRVAGAWQARPCSAVLRLQAKQATYACKMHPCNSRCMTPCAPQDQPVPSCLHLRTLFVLCLVP